MQETRIGGPAKARAVGTSAMKNAKSKSRPELRLAEVNTGNRLPICWLVGELIHDLERQLQPELDRAWPTQLVERTERTAAEGATS